MAAESSQAAGCQNRSQLANGTIHSSAPFIAGLSKSKQPEITGSDIKPEPPDPHMNPNSARRT